MVNRTGHVVQIEADAKTTYEVLFQYAGCHCGAYHTLRQEYAQKHYGCTYETCNAEQREMINEYYPQRISEGQIAQEGGAQ